MPEGPTGSPPVVAESCTCVHQQLSESSFDDCAMLPLTPMSLAVLHAENSRFMPVFNAKELCLMTTPE